jgi:hypothetical protein
MYIPGTGWLGNVDARSISEADLGPLSIAAGRVAVGVNVELGTVGASVSMAEDGLSGSAFGSAVGPATVLDEPTPIGAGWLGWYALPRLALTGSLSAGSTVMELSSASGYADHNWGRVHWGDDIGWEWGALLTPGGGPALVLTRVTDRRHQRYGRPALEVRWDGRIRHIVGSALSLRWGPATRLPSRRFPGALAALHADRRASRQPESLGILADDGHTRVAVRFVTESVTQIVQSDPIVRGYSFLHHLVGPFRATVRSRSANAEVEGLAVVERVE